MKKEIVLLTLLLIVKQMSRPIEFESAAKISVKM